MTEPTSTPSTPPANKPGGGGRPGGPQRRRQTKSRYGQQMSEKQGLKIMYGIREEQLRKYYAEAKRSSAQTGKELVTLLERRLDNAIYRAGFAPTRPAARQMSSHRLFTVNGRAVDVPSFKLKPGDVVAVKETKRDKDLFSNFNKRMQNVRMPSWLTLDSDTYSFKVVGIPSTEEANVGVDIQAIIEFFAR